MIINFRNREISRGARKLGRTHALIIIKKVNFNYEGCSLTDQVLDLFLKIHQFESHKPQDH
jgi:hypothetical protein